MQEIEQNSETNWKISNEIVWEEELEVRTQVMYSLVHLLTYHFYAWFIV
jgi:hypothetical protein